MQEGVAARDMKYVYFRGGGGRGAQLILKMARYKEIRYMCL